MTPSSVSFRITRHTEDLAQTIHALSQRVVQLEQRLAGLEAHLTAPEEDSLPSEHLASLANVDQLLRDCRELLGGDPPQSPEGPGEDPQVARVSRMDVALLDGMEEVA